MLRFSGVYGNYNVDVYPDPIYDDNSEIWHRVIIEKFTPTGKWLGKRSVYFSDYAYLTSEFTSENVETLWTLPMNAKVVDVKTTWKTTK